MSILIKDMEMPKTCFECPFMFSRRYCCADLTLDFYGDDGEYTELKGRVDGCPLVHVPPHGRLIDADCIGLTDFEIVMCNDSYKEIVKMLLGKIEDAPTIIPEEEDK